MIAGKLKVAVQSTGTCHAVCPEALHRWAISSLVEFGRLFFPFAISCSTRARPLSALVSGRPPFPAPTLSHPPFWNRSPRPDHQEEEENVEKWVVRAISEGVIDGRIDQLNRKVLVKSSFQRKFEKEPTPQFLTVVYTNPSLQRWGCSGKKPLTTLDWKEPRALSPHLKTLGQLWFSYSPNHYGKQLMSAVSARVLHSGLDLRQRHKPRYVHLGSDRHGRLHPRRILAAGVVTRHFHRDKSARREPTDTELVRRARKSGPSWTRS